MKHLGRKILLGLGTVAAVSFAAGAFAYKRYMDDFYEFIMDEDYGDDMDLLDETGIGEEDFAETAAQEDQAETAF